MQPDLPTDEQLLTFGHEWGHFFLEEVAGVWQHGSGHNNDVERFCDFFGREMVVSHDTLRTVSDLNPSSVIELMDHYGASHQTILLQLILAAKLPKRIVVDSGIGEVPNPYYSNKVGRHVICIECELGIKHAKYEEVDAVSNAHDFVAEFNYNNGIIESFAEVGV